MSGRHTPGPWKATQYGDIQPEAGGALVASTSGKSGYFRSAYKEDAMLIAAAPGLLEACELALRFITNGIELGYIDTPDNFDTAALVPDKLMEAIAAARGKAL